MLSFLCWQGLKATGNTQSWTACLVLPSLVFPRMLQMQSDGNFLSSQWGKRRWGHTNIFHRALRVLMMSVLRSPFQVQEVM